jgi:molybdate/tungstate transport system substrate-binding protein
LRAPNPKPLARRELLLRGGRLAVAGAIAGLSGKLLGAGMPVLDVAYAGSMGSLMESPIKAGVARTLKVDFHGRAEGSNALAQLIVGGSIRPDVFLPVTPSPMLTVIRAGKAESAQPVARTEMVIAYSPKSRFASQFEDARRGKGAWWEILEQPGLRFGRTDPVTDPQGRNIIFAIILAARAYNRPDLVEKILGPTINQKQIFSEPTLQARLQSGELDAASAYEVQPGPFNVPYITLPAEVNLSDQNVAGDHPEVTLTVGGRTYRPEPLIYYAAVLKDTQNPKGAHAFVEWLKGNEAQAIFGKFHYDPPGDAAALHA